MVNRLSRKFRNSCSIGRQEINTRFKMGSVPSLIPDFAAMGFFLGLKFSIRPFDFGLKEGHHV